MWANKCALFLVINGSRFCEGLSGFFINDDSVFLSHLRILGSFACDFAVWCKENSFDMDVIVWLSFIYG